jgi:formyl-CoA transferase
VQARDGLPGRRGTGEGQIVDVALSESVFDMLESLLPEYDQFDVVRKRSGSKLEGIVPTGTYPCRPGPGGEERWIAIGANSDSMFQRLLKVMDRSDLAVDPQLRHNDGRVEHEAMLDEAIAAWTSAHTLEYALEKLEQAEVAAGPIQSIADIAEDPQFIARAMFEQVELPGGGTLRVPGWVPKLSATPAQTQWAGPELGAHTKTALVELLGYDDAELQRLADAEVIAGPEFLPVEEPAS